MTEPANPKSAPEPAKSGLAVNGGTAFESCKHLRKRLIAKDEDAEYWECFDCGEIFEPGEAGGVVNLDGSLSDA
jgi:hypothetical protein